MDVRVVDHPLAAARLTTLRDERTNNASFRDALRDLTLMLVYEATRDAATESIPVRTPLADTTGALPARPARRRHHRIAAGHPAAAGARAAGRPRHGRPGACTDPGGTRRL